jgi:hypothetical protein
MRWRMRVSSARLCSLSRLRTRSSSPPGNRSTSESEDLEINQQVNPRLSSRVQIQKEFISDLRKEIRDSYRDQWEMQYQNKF